jgi:hypothetical protein
MLHAWKLDLKLYWKDVHFKADLKDDMKRMIDWLSLDL